MISPIVTIFSFCFGMIIASAAWYYIARSVIRSSWREMLAGAFREMQPKQRQEFLCEVTRQLCPCGDLLPGHAHGISEDELQIMEEAIGHRPAPPTIPGDER